MPFARSFVVLMVDELAGNTRPSPATGARPPTQLAPLLQLPLAGLALQVFVAACAVEALTIASAIAAHTHDNGVLRHPAGRIGRSFLAARRGGSPRVRFS